MPLTPNAPNLLPDTSAVEQQSPSYSPPDMGEFTDPREVIADDQARNSDAATFLQGASDAANTSLRARAFNLQQQQIQQQMQLDALLNPLKVAAAQAQSTIMQQQVDHSTDAFTRLPQFADQINTLDPSADDFGVQVSNILAKASDNPTLFAQLQPMVENAKAKRQAYLQTTLGAPGAQIAQDAKTGNPTAIAAWQDWQNGVKNGTDPTTMLGKFAAYQNQKAVAIKNGYQQQLLQLGPYAPPLPPKLSMGIYDPEEIQGFQKDVEDAAKQKEEAQRMGDTTALKNQGATDVQTLKNQGRMDVTMYRFGQSPAAQTEQGKQLVQMANSLNEQMKNPNVAPADKIRMQGQLDGINDEMTRQLGLPAPAAAPATPGDAADQNASDLLDKAIGTVQGQIDLGNPDLPKGVSLPGGLTDPVQKGIFSSNVPDKMTPNEFRLQQLQNLKAEIISRQMGAPAPSGAQPAAAAGPSGVADTGTMFAPVLNGTAAPDAASLTPDTDAALSQPGAPMFAGGPVVQPSAALSATVDRSVTKKIGPQTVTVTPNSTSVLPRGQAMRPPPAEAVAYLRAHPETANKFDQTFGPGASKRILGQN